MTSREQLIDQHIREYESRLKHIDELYQRAHEATEHLEDHHETRKELNTYARQLKDILQNPDDIKTMPAADWRRQTATSAGPMAIWDILAQKLEDFIERHE